LRCGGIDAPCVFDGPILFLPPYSPDLNQSMLIGLADICGISHLISSWGAWLACPV
jgi:hypothetical protein